MVIAISIMLPLSQGSGRPNPLWPYVDSKPPRGPLIIWVAVYHPNGHVIYREEYFSAVISGAACLRDWGLVMEDELVCANFNQ